MSLIQVNNRLMAFRTCRLPNKTAGSHDIMIMRWISRRLMLIDVWRTFRRNATPIADRQAESADQTTDNDESFHRPFHKTSNLSFDAPVSVGQVQAWYRSPFNRWFVLYLFCVECCPAGAGGEISIHSPPRQSKNRNGGPVVTMSHHRFR